MRVLEIALIFAPETFLCSAQPSRSLNRRTLIDSIKIDDRTSSPTRMGFFRDGRGRIMEGSSFPKSRGGVG